MFRVFGFIFGNPWSWSSGDNLLNKVWGSPTVDEKYRTLQMTDWKWKIFPLQMILSVVLPVGGLVALMYFVTSWLILWKVLLSAVCFWGFFRALSFRTFMAKAKARHVELSATG